MSYIQTQWATGDTVTAEKLNKMENGIADNSALVVPIYHEVEYPEGGSPYDEYYVPAEYAQAVYDGFFEHLTVFFSFYEVYSSGIPQLEITFEAKWIKSEVGFLPSLAVFTTDYLERELTYSIQITKMANEKPYDTWVLNKTGYVAGERWYLTASTVDTDFVITLTPTAQDFSGIMDKTPAEIYEAFQVGKKIKGIVAGMGSTIDFTAFVENNGAVNCQASFVYSISDTPVLMNIITNSISSIYTTQIFPLTPMS